MTEQRKIVDQAGLCDMPECPNEWTHVACPRGMRPIRRCKEHRMTNEQSLDMLAESGRIVKR